MNNIIKITTGQNEYEWNACFGDYDLGVPVGTGKTEAVAMIDLINLVENVNGRISGGRR